MKVFSLKERLDLLPDNANVAEALEQGLASSRIAIPGADPFQPLFDPASARTRPSRTALMMWRMSLVTSTPSASR